MSRVAPAGALAVVAALTAVLSGPPPTAPAAFPGANGKIIFYSTRDGSPEVFVTEAGGKDQHGFDPAAIGYFPSFSPGSKKIAYQSTGGPARIVVMRADGTNRRPITPKDVFSANPAFGRGLIAFSREVKDNEDIYLIRPNGSHERRLTRHPRDEHAAAFSPNGKWVVFTGQTPGVDLFRVNVKTKRVRRLTHTDSVEENEANVSPDGKRIAFTRYDDGTYDIGIMRADGSHRRMLTDDSEFDAFPCFSPNGKRIAFSHIESGESEEEIVVMDLDGRHRKPITDIDGQDVAPDWGVERR